MRKHGRDNLKEIAAMLSDKTLDEVTAYHHAFWSRGKDELGDFDRIVASLLKAEKERNKEKTVADAFDWKMTSYNCPELELNVLYKAGNPKSNLFTAEQDKTILCYLYEFGFDIPGVFDYVRYKIL